MVQKCLEHGTVHNASFVINELMPSFNLLITHQYGNYVLQKVLRRLKKVNVHQFNALKAQIMSEQNELLIDVWGREVVKTCKRM